MRLGLSARDPLGDCKPAGLPFGAIFGGCIGRGERTHSADPSSLWAARVWRVLLGILALKAGRSVEVLRVGISIFLFEC